MHQQIPQWLNRFYYYIRILSIDIVLGAVSVSLFASHLFNSQIPSVYWLLLPVAVWLIYTFDHISDGLTIESPLKKTAYKYHYNNRAILIPITIVLSLTLMVLFFVFYDISLLIIAFIGGIWIGIYFLAHKILPVKLRNWFPKEILIAVGYIIGTLGVPYLTKSKSITRIDVIIMICYFLLVLTNVLIYSYFDFEEDKQFGFAGIILATGIKTGYKILLSLVIISDILSLYLLLYNSNSISILLMSLGMSLIIFKPMFFKKNMLYGKIADALFLLPGLIIIV